MQPPALRDVTNTRGRRQEKAVMICEVPLETGMDMELGARRGERCGHWQGGRGLRFPRAEAVSTGARRTIPGGGLWEWRQERIPGGRNCACKSSQS